MVWLMFERLVWILFPVIVSITQFSDFWLMSYGNLKHILGVFSFHNSVFNGIFVIKTIYWVPLVLSFQLSLLSPFGLFFFFFFFLHFSFFLSSSLSILLQSKKFILTDHSHTILSFLFFSHWSLTHWPMPTHLSLSFTVPMPKSSYSPIYWREKLRDHQRQSSITRRKASPRACSPHCCYRTRSSIWSEHQNWHPQQRWISVGNNSIWKLLCRHQEQLHWKRFYWVLLFLDSFF